MKKIIYLLLICIILSGCSLLKIAASPFKSTPRVIPTKISKSEKQIYHKTPEGEILKYREKIYNQEERKLTLKERFLNFLTNLKGYLFWLVIISIILTATGFGWVSSFFWQVLFGMGKVVKSTGKALYQTVKAIQKAKQNGGNYLQELKSEEDEESKQIINKIRAEL